MWTQLNLRNIQEAPQIERKALQTEVAVAEARLPEAVAVPEIRAAKAIRDTSLGT
jgi:hypothetical protein